MCNTTRGGSSRKQVQLRPHPICNTTSQLDFQTQMEHRLECKTKKKGVYFYTPFGHQSI